jgi:hypothetical protein
MKVGDLVNRKHYKVNQRGTIIEYYKHARRFDASVRILWEDGRLEWEHPTKVQIIKKLQNNT